MVPARTAIREKTAGGSQCEDAPTETTSRILPADIQHSPKYWRSRAAGARAMLEDARDPKVRTYLAEIAQEYERLAAIAEERQRADE